MSPVGRPTTTTSQAIIEDVRELLDWVDQERDNTSSAMAEAKLSAVSGRIGRLLDRAERGNPNWLEDDVWRQAMEMHFRKQEQTIRYYHAALIGHFAECEAEAIDEHVRILAAQAKALGIKLSEEDLGGVGDDRG